MSSRALLEEIRAKPLPEHVAIIMDGNGRWAKARGLPRTEGHRQGAKTVERIARFVAQEKLFPYLTVFAFSTENWDRPKKELDFLFFIFENFAREHLEELVQNGVRLRILGDISPFPESLREALEAAVEKTRGGKTLVSALAAISASPTFSSLRPPIPNSISRKPFGPISPRRISFWLSAIFRAGRATSAG